MASMLSLVPRIPQPGRWVSPGAPAITLNPVRTHNVETASEKRPRTLKHLLRANHINYAIQHVKDDRCNSLPNILCSAYLLGADTNLLHEIYDREAAHLGPWEDSPQEIIQDDWKEFFGQRPYQRAYLDFFEDALAMRHAYDWKSVIHEYLLGGDEPLINGLIGSHALSPLAYAYEMDNRELAMEALALAATSYSHLHKYLDEPSYTRPSSESSTCPIELLNRIAADDRFTGLLSEPSWANMDILFEKAEDLMLEYWNSWTLDDPVTQFQQSQRAAVALLVATVPQGEHVFDSYMAHILIVSHAVRVLLPVMPAKLRLGLLRAWWLEALALYISVLRPRIDLSILPDDTRGIEWPALEARTLGSLDTAIHCIEVVRAIKVAACTWGDDDRRFLAAAIRFVDDFFSWSRAASTKKIS